MNFERNINYYELDGMNVVHHSNYIRYMEEARIYLLDKIGLPYKKIEDNGIMIPVLEVNYKYKNPAKFGDTIVVKVNISEFDGIRLKMQYEITNKETGKLEMHFDKDDYMALPEESKKEIKSNFLFSRKAGAWVSRAKFPNLWRAEAVAKKLGLEDGGKVGIDGHGDGDAAQKQDRSAHAHSLDHIQHPVEIVGVGGHPCY